MASTNSTQSCSKRQPGSVRVTSARPRPAPRDARSFSPFLGTVLQKHIPRYVETTPAKDPVCRITRPYQPSNCKRNAASRSIHKQSPSGEACTVCKAGSTANDVRSACDVCAKGRAGKGGMCDSCHAGTQPSASLAECVKCPAGRAGTDGTCQACAAGKEPGPVRPHATPSLVTYLPPSLPPS